MKTLLLVGDDKLGRTLVQRCTEHPRIVVAWDRSTNLRRISFLLRRGAIPPGALVRMLVAELQRPGRRATRRDAPEIRNNADLLALIERERIQRLMLFRAGLIVRREVLASGAQILNVHCASLDGYGGLASIYRALRDRALDQHATLHRVTERIDRGEVLDTEPYELDPRLSYRENEDRAYTAGMRLIERALAAQIARGR